MSRPVGEPGWLDHRKIAELRAMRRAKMTVEEIAAAAGVTRGTVSRHTSDLGPRPNGWEHRTVKQELEVVGLSSKLPIKAIAKVTGLSPSVVLDVRRKYHVVSRFGRQHAARNRYAWDERAWGLLIEELYFRRRLGMDDTAEVLGIHVSTLSRRMRDLGMRIREPGEARRDRPRGRYELGLPTCAAEGCETRVRTPEETLCAACRRSFRR